MSAATCPHCDAILPPQELADGWCETCGKRIPSGIIAAAGRWRGRGPATSLGSGQPAADDHFGPCRACGVEAPRRYVVFYQNIGMLIVRTHRSVEGHLCKACI